MRELTKGKRRYRGKPHEARDALAALMEAGHLQWDHAAVGGHPAERFVVDRDGVPTVPVRKSPCGDAVREAVGDGYTGGEEKSEQE